MTATAPAGAPTLEESASSARALRGFWAWLLYAFAVGTTSYHIAFLSFFSVDPWLYLGISLGCFWVLGFLIFPANRRSPRQRPSVVDFALCLLAVATTVYLGIEFDDMYARVGFNPTRADAIWGAVATLLTLEMSRRVLGWTFPLMSGACIVYAIYGNLLPGVWGHRGYVWERVASTLYSSEGLYGSAMSAAATYIVLFVTFGAFLRATNVGPLFIQLATSIAGRARGGPAKVAVISSALFGTISGSSMGNVAAVGTFTIPLMKKIGYKPTFAAAVEAAASTGGQIMPPVMGAVAFVLAEATMTPYREVMLAAIIPAVCYFTTIYFVIDFEARKLGLRGASADEIPRVVQVLRTGWLLLVPIAVLVFMIVGLNRSIVQSALVCIVIAVLADWIRRRRPMGVKAIGSALNEGAIGSVEAVAACACAGIMIGVFALTGLGNRFVELVLTYGEGQMILALVIVMIVTILLGFPLPTVAAYVITAAVGAPVLVKLGIPMLAAHMFIMYYACVSTVTPPIALSAFAAAGIAGSDPDKTGWMATRLTIAAYIVPFAFIFNPAVLWQGHWADILRALVLCTVAGYALAGATNSNHPAIGRVVFFAAALAVLSSSITVNAAGIAGIAAVLLFSRVREARARPSGS